MKLLHVFEENKNILKRKHLEHWLGFPQDEDQNEDGSFTACYCGGKIVPMAKDEYGNIEIGAIWHLRRFTQNDLNERE